MRTVAAVVGACLLWSVPARAEEKAVAFIDLQPKANQKLTEPFHRGVEGNSLADLPRGEQTFAKVKFKVGDSAIQLGSTLLKDKPEKVEDIAVGREFARLHLLHATGNGAYGKEGDPLFVADDTLIGEYKVHYEDKSVETIPVVYGKDLRDWWDWDSSKAVTRGEVAWKGANDYSKQFNVSLRLYRGTWTNPHPDKKVTHLDYVSTGKTACAPFCVALTAEGP